VVPGVIFLLVVVVVVAVVVDVVVPGVIFLLVVVVIVCEFIFESTHPKRLYQIKIAVQLDVADIKGNISRLQKCDMTHRSGFVI